MHAADPTFAEYLPCAQSVHDDAPELEYLPAVGRNGVEHEPWLRGMQNRPPLRSRPLSPTLPFCSLTFADSTIYRFSVAIGATVTRGARGGPRPHPRVVPGAAFKTLAILGRRRIPTAFAVDTGDRIINVLSCVVVVVVVFVCVCVCVCVWEKEGGEVEGEEVGCSHVTRQFSSPIPTRFAVAARDPVL